MRCKTLHKTGWPSQPWLQLMLQLWPRALQSFQEFPSEIQRLCEGQDELSVHFRAKIRNYNNGLAMAYMTATVGTPNGGSPLHPKQPTVLAQIYNFDTGDNELAGRPCNRTCSRDLFALLYNVTQKGNIFAQSYRLMEEVARKKKSVLDKEIVSICL